MTCVITTVFFDGRFWVALVEKTGDDGLLSVGRHVFGAEPSNPELVEFMLESYGDVPTRASGERVRLQRAKSPREQARETGKALRAFSGLQRARLEERKVERKRNGELEDRERFLLKVKRRKERKRGH